MAVTVISSDGGDPLWEDKGRCVWAASSYPEGG